MTDPARNSQPGYETADTNPRALAALGAVLAGLVVVSLAVAWWVQGALGAGDEPVEDPMRAFRQGPQGPLLQASPTVEIDDHEREVRQRLNSYGWIDETSGIVHIPIERAMAITAERGLPSRDEEPGR